METTGLWNGWFSVPSIDRSPSLPSTSLSVAKHDLFKLQVALDAYTYLLFPSMLCKGYLKCITVEAEYKSCK